jgi:tRNA dimethylallyltransferase
MSNGQSPGNPSTSSGPVALIAGPTASGKSDLAVALARELERRGARGVVINADSAQVYRDLAVLSARPTEEDMRGVEHRLFGAWDGAEPCSAAEAKREIEDVHVAGAVPILVGGTGLYIRTLLDGIAPVPKIDPAIREAVRSLPTGDAYAALQREDPQRAKVLHANDSLRIARSLEVVRSSGKPLAFWQQVRVGGILQSVALHPLLLMPHLGWLHSRCDQRFAEMLERGAEQEVKALFARNLRSSLPVMRAIGVREIVGWLSGVWSREEAITRGQRATWQYARRQFTWFRRQSPEDWPRIEKENYDMFNPFETLFRYLGLT